MCDITWAVTFNCYWIRTESMDKDQRKFTFVAVTMPFLFYKGDFDVKKCGTLQTTLLLLWSTVRLSGLYYNQTTHLYDRAY